MQPVRNLINQPILASVLMLTTLLPLPAMAQESTITSTVKNNAMEWIDAISNTTILNFTISELALSFFIILATFLLRRVLTRIVFSRLKRLATRTTWKYDDQLVNSLEPPFIFFLLIFGLYLAVVVLPIEPVVRSGVNLVFRGLGMASLFWAISRAVGIMLDAAAAKAKAEESGIGDFMPLIKKAVNVFIIVVAAIMVIDNLGYSVSGMIATLGLGGAALALAAQDTIANIYGAAAIATDRPFKVGDWIQVGDKVDGQVEEIGIRSTRVRTWPKAIIVIPNSVLCNEYITNWSRMPCRRIRQTIGVTYSTTAPEMTTLLVELRELLKNHPGLSPDGQHVRFTDFGASSLDILVNYFTEAVDYASHVEIREAINLRMMEIVAAHSLSFAFPTRTVHFEGEYARAIAERGQAKPAIEDAPRSTE